MKSFLTSAAECQTAKNSKLSSSVDHQAVAYQKQLLETPIDYDSLVKVGAIMGSGGIVVLDEDDCMVDTARYFTEFCVDESCGRCTPCRAGLPRMLEVFEQITHGQGEMSDIGTLEKASVFIRDASLCGLGQTAPNPVITTLRYFKDEYIQPHTGQGM